MLLYIKLLDIKDKDNSNSKLDKIKRGNIINVDNTRDNAIGSIKSEDRDSSIIDTNKNRPYSNNNSIDLNNFLN